MINIDNMFKDEAEEVPPLFCAIEIEPNGQQRITTPEAVVKHELKHLFKRYPNNAELGAKIRLLYK